MDKYAVETNRSAAKTASETPTCPRCGGPLDGQANVPKCLYCGTTPFEEDPCEQSPGLVKVPRPFLL